MNTIPKPSKPWYLSKTFWVNLVALASLVFPPVREWLASNPVEFGAALAAANVLLRFVTRERLSFSRNDGSDEDRGGPGWGPGAVVLLAVLSIMVLPSCSVVGSAVTGQPIPALEVARAGAKDSTVVWVSAMDWREAEATARGEAAAGPMANRTTWGLYDAGRAAAAVRGVFTEGSK